MTTSNARRYLFLERAVSCETPGKQVTASINAAGAVLLLDNEFALHCYSSSAVSLRSITHMLPNKIDDPIITGFRTRHHSEAGRLELQVLLNKHIAESRALRNLRASTDQLAILALLYTLFCEFQPVRQSDHLLLEGARRSKTYYDVPRLLRNTISLSQSWHFIPRSIIAAYEAKPRPASEVIPGTDVFEYHRTSPPAAACSAPFIKKEPLRSLTAKPSRARRAHIKAEPAFHFAEHHDAANDLPPAFPESFMALLSSSLDQRAKSPEPLLPQHQPEASVLNDDWQFSAPTPRSIAADPVDQELQLHDVPFDLGAYRVDEDGGFSGLPMLPIFDFD